MCGIMWVCSLAFLSRSGDQVEYRILGRTEVLQNGTPLRVIAPRHRKLLAALLVHADDVVPAERLIEDLWGDDAPRSAPAILHVRISELRGALRGSSEADSAGILTRGSGYSLVVGPDDLDARSFERLSTAGHSALRQGDNVGASTRLAEALAMWRGPPLDDVADEDFAQVEIARLEALHLQALEDNLDVELALGRHAEVVAQLSGLVAEHPMRERFWAQLMLAQFRAGRQADALASFAQARDLLVDQLGVDLSCSRCMPPSSGRTRRSVCRPRWSRLTNPRTTCRGASPPSWGATHRAIGSADCCASNASSRWSAPAA